MRFTAILCLALLAAASGFAQQKVIDSLLRILPETKQDTNRVNILNKLAAKYYPIDPDEGIKYGQQALKLAETLRWKKGIASAYNKLGINHKVKGDYPKAIEWYTKALALFTELGDKSGVASIWGNIANINTLQGNAEEAIENYDKQISICEGIGNMAGIAKANGNLAIVYSDMGDFAKAVRYFGVALQIHEELGEKEEAANILLNIANVYQYESDFPKAIESYFKALRTYEELGNKAGVAGAYVNLGAAYGNLGDTIRQKQFQLTALARYIEIGDKVNIALMNNNIGQLYSMQHDYPAALRYYFAALAAQDSLGLKQDWAITAGNIGGVYIALNDDKTAMHYLQQALNVAREVGDKEGESSILSNIGKVHLKAASGTGTFFPVGSLSASGRKEQLQLAISRLKQAVDISAAIGDRYYAYLPMDDLATAYAMAGNDKEALRVYREYTTIRDSVLNADKGKKIVQLQMQYDFEKKEAATKALNDKNLAVMAESAKSRLIVIGTIAGSLIILTFAGFYFYRRREKYLLEQQIKEVKQEALNAQMSDHFIGNVMDTINNFIRDNNREKASEYLIMFSRLIRRVLENAEAKMVPIADDLAILKDYIELEKLRYTGDGIQYELEVDQGLDTSSVMVPPMVLQVLAENAIKHGFEKSVGGAKILFRVRKSGNCLECTVEDNGQGRSLAAREQTGVPKKRKSFGGSLAEKLVRAAGGRSGLTSFNIIDLYDAVNRPAGTKVVFTLPFITAE